VFANSIGAYRVFYRSFVAFKTGSKHIPNAHKAIIVTNSWCLKMPRFSAFVGPPFDTKGEPETHQGPQLGVQGPEKGAT